MLQLFGTDAYAIVNTITVFYNSLFETTHPSPDCIDYILQWMSCSVTEEMNDNLLQPFTMTDVQKLFSLWL